MFQVEEQSLVTVLPGTECKVPGSTSGRLAVSLIAGNGTLHQWPVPAPQPASVRPALPEMTSRWWKTRRQQINPAGLLRPAKRGELGLLFWSVMSQGFGPHCLPHRVKINLMFKTTRKLPCQRPFCNFNVLKSTDHSLLEEVSFGQNSSFLFLLLAQVELFHFFRKWPFLHEKCSQKR